MDRPHRRAFTLVELLVVIAVIALLIAMLLPALSRARKAAWMSISLTNLRQITVGATTYREEYKGNYPLWPVFRGGRYDPLTKYTGLDYGGWCTWAFGGKNNNRDYASSDLYGGILDIEAADRKLNPYVVPDAIVDAPDLPQRMAPADVRRLTTQLFVFRDPSDIVTYQRRSSNWNTAQPPVSDPLSSYDDVGTSYHFNVNWWQQFEGNGILNRLGGFRAFSFGCERLRLADSFTPSRMVWVNDQYVDVGANNDGRGLKLRNGYGDTNKGLMAFVDGHVAYHPVFPGGSTNPKAFKNEFYTTVFEDLRPPTN